MSLLTRPAGPPSLAADSFGCHGPGSSQAVALDQTSQTSLIVGNDATAHRVPGGPCVQRARQRLGGHPRPVRGQRDGALGVAVAAVRQGPRPPVQSAVESGSSGTPG